MEQKRAHQHQFWKHWYLAALVHFLAAVLVTVIVALTVILTLPFAAASIVVVGAMARRSRKFVVPVAAVAPLS